MYVFALLFLPVAVIGSTAIYSISSPDFINYKYLNYNFSILALPSIALAYFVKGKVQVIPIGRIIVLILVWNVLHAIAVGNDVFSSFHIEMFLVMIQAWSLLILVFYTHRSVGIHQFIDVYVLLCFLSQITRMLLDYSTDGRYGAVGLSVGGSGFLYSIYIVYLINCRDLNVKTIAMLGIALIGLILTGQRTSFAFLVIFIVPSVIGGVYDLGRSARKTKREFIKYLFLTLMFVLAFSLLLVISLLILIGYDFDYLPFINRGVEAIDGAFSGNFGEISSVSGRVLSILTGIDVLLQNPWGLSNDFFDLQRNIESSGYPTFPHSTALSMLLLWSSPIAIFCFAYILKLWASLWLAGRNYHSVILFLICMSVFWGGPFLDYPFLFVLLFFVSLGVIERDNFLLMRKKERPF